jgi:hypothetical protein
MGLQFPVRGVGAGGAGASVEQHLGALHITEDYGSQMWSM